MGSWCLWRPFGAGDVCQGADNRKRTDFLSLCSKSCIGFSLTGLEISALLPLDSKWGPCPRRGVKPVCTLSSGPLGRRCGAPQRLWGLLLGIFKSCLDGVLGGPAGGMNGMRCPPELTFNLSHSVIQCRVVFRVRVSFGFTVRVLWFVLDRINVWCRIR